MSLIRHPTKEKKKQQTNFALGEKCFFWKQTKKFMDNLDFVGLTYTKKRKKEDFRDRLGDAFPIMTISLHWLVIPDHKPSTFIIVFPFLYSFSDQFLSHLKG